VRQRRSRPDRAVPDDQGRHRRPRRRQGDLIVMRDTPTLKSRRNAWI
jgi:hypothetical protein